MLEYLNRCGFVTLNNAPTTCAYSITSLVSLGFRKLIFLWLLLTTNRIHPEDVNIVPTSNLFVPRLKVINF